MTQLLYCLMSGPRGKKNEGGVNLFGVCVGRRRRRLRNYRIVPSRHWLVEGREE